MPPRKPAAKKPEPQGHGSLRLQTFLARAGVASRRASEELIRDRRVVVNGRPAELGSSVDPNRDVVRVDGHPVHLKPSEWLALHKPRGYVSTRDDPEGRKTIYELLPKELHHLFHVGRLDRSSSGLLLMTNDGELANRLLHPRYGTTKEYVVDVEGTPDTRTLRQLVDGVQLEDGIASALSVETRGESAPDVSRLVVVLEEGRNREVRRMMEAIGHPVKRLFRRSFGPIKVGNLAPGRWRRLTSAEVGSLAGAESAAPAATPRRRQGPAGSGGAPRRPGGPPKRPKTRR
jgi:23S rRNA pseudouridine2605 synthase